MRMGATGATVYPEITVPAPGAAMLSCAYKPVSQQDLVYPAVDM